MLPSVLKWQAMYVCSCIYVITARSLHIRASGTISHVVGEIRETEEEYF
jgi:hypothetical protein